MDFSVIKKLDAKGEFADMKDEYISSFSPMSYQKMRAEKPILTQTIRINFFPNSANIYEPQHDDFGNPVKNTLYDPSTDATLEKVGRLAGQYERAVIAIVGHTDNSMKGRVNVEETCSRIFWISSTNITARNSLSIPRTRLSPTKAAQPGSPVLVEHEYERKGALNLFAAFNTRTGCVIGSTYSRKRQRKFIDFLEKIENETDPSVTKIHLVRDNLNAHSGREVVRWLQGRPRFFFHFTPVHCSWMNQGEQWFGILQRKRFTIANVPSIRALAGRIAEFISQWNQHAAPFKWTRQSFDKVLQKAERELREAA